MSIKKIAFTYIVSGKRPDLVKTLSGEFLYSSIQVVLVTHYALDVYVAYILKCCNHNGCIAYKHRNLFKAVPYK